MKLTDSYAERICTKCGAEGGLEKFAPRSGCPGKLQSWCRACMSKARRPATDADAEYQREWRKNNPEKMKGYYRRGDLKRKFGITPEEYESILDSQGGTCAVCKSPPTATRLLAVDHDHSTGEVRSVLCGPCNVALGMLKDSPIRIRALAFYIESWVEWKSISSSSVQA